MAGSVPPSIIEFGRESLQAMSKSASGSWHSGMLYHRGESQWRLTF
jgi:hypothetical protein